MKLRPLSRIFAGLAGALAITQAAEMPPYEMHGSLAAQHPLRGEHIIRLDAPAAAFTESTPLGNGRLGAMIFGGVTEERIVVNESGMWSGSPQDADRTDAAAALPEIRRLLLEGKNAEAEKLVNERFTCAGAGSGRGRGANIPYGSYQLLGDLTLKFVHPGAAAPFTDYRRELDLSEAVARLTYLQDGVHYTREAFVSGYGPTRSTVSGRPAHWETELPEVLVLRFTADQAAALSFDVGLSRPERATTRAEGSEVLAFEGALPDGKGGENVRFAARLRVVAKGGSVRAVGATLQVREADEVLIYVAGTTDIGNRSFAGRKTGNVAESVRGDIERAVEKKFDGWRTSHVAEYRQWYDRVSLQLGAADAPPSTLSTPERLKAFAAGAPDPGLAALYFNFGRYLLISSSRPGGLPANLQGIWADGINTPWNGDWHLNINVQMNYWLAEVGNLSELHQPLFALINSLTGPGAKTAKDYYGARGWVAHVITNPWGFTAPGESAQWGSTSSGSAWLCTHLWEHWLFTHDRRFLAQAYPVLKGSAEFYLDMLIAEPTHGWLVTAPSNSPENVFEKKDGTKAHICLGATIDEQLVRALFEATSMAAKELGLDADFARELDEKRAQLAPTRIGTDGRVMEWQEEYAEPEPHHRHVSHLWGLYPGHEIDPRAQPELAAAAAKTLDARGDAGTGWGTAFKLGMWARLGNGSRAYDLLREHLQPAKPSEKPGVWTGGIYPNLFGAHPPFQIDGNLGGPAVIAEMLLLSREVDPAGLKTEIRLLPALPPAWPEGSVRGLKARGGYEVDFSWRDGKVVAYAVRATRDGEVTLICNNGPITRPLKAGEAWTMSASPKP